MTGVNRPETMEKNIRPISRPDNTETVLTECNYRGRKFDIPPWELIAVVSQEV